MAKPAGMDVLGTITGAASAIRAFAFFNGAAMVTATSLRECTESAAGRGVALALLAAEEKPARASFDSWELSSAPVWG
jgi:hypothetical protein